MKRPEERGSFGLWLRQERLKRYRNTQKAVAAVTASGHNISVSEWAALESGTQKPSQARRTALEAFFGSQSPVDPEQGQVSSTAILEAIRALTAAQEAQAEAMQEIVAEMRLARATTQARSEGMAVALGDLADTLGRLRLAPVEPPQQ